MTTLNVLFTSAGRRVSLIQSFQKTWKSMGLTGTFLATDLTPELSPACQDVDLAMTSPRVTNPGYPQFLKSLIKTHGIHIVIPTIDPELPVLAKIKAELAAEDVWVLVPDLGQCESWNSKKKTAQWFQNHGLKTPHIYPDLSAINFPCFAKLDESSCSKGAQIVHTLAQAETLLAQDPSYVFQELLQGEEYTVDIYLSRKTKSLVAAVNRKRLEVRAGEVSKGITEHEDAVTQAIQKFSQVCGTEGVLTVQVMRHHGELYFIEVNPRFGGGYPLTYQAGANFAQYIANDYLGNPNPPFTQWQDKLLMLRYDAEIFTQ